MKHLVIALVSLLSLQSIAQIKDPTTWSTRVEKLADGEYKLITDVFIEPKWHVYSQAKLETDEGPIATKFGFFTSDGNYELVGVNKEFTPYAEYSPVWEFDVYQFENSARFEQIIKVTNPALKHIIVQAYFMVCDETQCLPPSPEALVFKLDPNAPDIDGEALINGFYDAKVEPLVATGPKGADIKKKASAVSKDVKKPIKSKDNPTSNKGLWAIFWIAFGSGFLALLTPCVFPMIPLTVSFFTKQSKSRAKGITNAIIYGLSIIIIYVILGTAVTAIFGSEALSELSTSVAFNLIFFAILMVFAISFLGGFEITLPQSWANSADDKASKGGIIGIFFMALALAIVSFSCTGPIVGSLIVDAASKGGIAPVVGMFGFSLAIALPFTLFAIFPSWLNSLPKSGGWLNTVKVFLGFLELALAFKFLSNADLVSQWHFLEREVFLAIWIAIFGALALYLFGKIRLAYDGPDPIISTGRLLLGIFFTMFTVYLIPGLWGAPLKTLSGFAPPLFYSESPNGVGYSNGGFTTNDVSLPDGAHYGVHNIIAFDDYDKGKAYAQEVGKPILIDFTGWACVNCRRMEERVWGEKKVLDILKNDVVLISLYVDQKENLPKEEQYTSKTTGKRVRTIGNKWSDLQVSKYNVNAQPYYVLQNSDGTDMAGISPVGYTPSVEDYLAWLQSGLK